MKLLYSYMFHYFHIFYFITEQTGQTNHFRFNHDIVITYKRRLNCAKDILLEEFRKAYSIMNTMAQEFR